MGFIYLISPTRMPCFKRIVCFIAASALLNTAAPASDSAIALLRSDSEQVSFEVKIENYHLLRSGALEGMEKMVIPGYDSRSNPGEPSLPSRRFLVAVPPDVSYTLRWTVLKAVPLGHHRLEPVPIPNVLRDDAGEPFISERYELDENLYLRYERKSIVEDEGIAFLRHQRVLTVCVHPVSYDPGSGETSIATHIRVELSFSHPGGMRSNTLLDEELTPVRESAVWKRILSRSLVNPEQAVEWRIKRRIPGQRDRQALAPGRTAITGPLVKLKVRETGMHRVSASSVITAGFSMGEPVNNLHLFKRQYDATLLQESIVDIPFAVSEDPAGIDGVFDGSDWLIFHGLSLREDSLQGDPVEKFADYNGYWLGTGGGPSMVQRPLPYGFISDDTASVSFEVVDRYEEDNWFIEFTPPDAQGFYDDPLRIDVYAYSTYKVSALLLPFHVHAMKPGTTLQVKAELLSAPKSVKDMEVSFTIENSIGNTPLNSVIVPEDQRVLYTSQQVPSNVMSEGENQLRIDEDDPDRGTLEAYFHWFTVSYQSLYRAEENILFFNTASLTGDTSITITGLTRKDLYLFDVTDPYQSLQCVVTDNHFTDIDGGYAFSFRDGISSQKRYVLTPLDGIPEVAPEDIVPGKSSSLIGNPLENGVDVLIVYYQGFLNDIQQWVDYRRAQGYKVLMADANDVYDEFNSGVPHPRAIKNFIRHFFYEPANASFVVLVGDASEDNKNIQTDSAPNFLPTESFPEYVGGSFDMNEMVTTDKWYVLMDDNWQNDPYPDLIIGRLPAGSTLELQAMLNKIFAYEQPGASDFWRRRMVMIADDAWYGSAFDLCYNKTEEGFANSTTECAALIESSQAGGYEVVMYNLSEYTYQVHPPIGACDDILGETILFVRQEATPKLKNELGKGATLVGIQAHMNRHQICHEMLFTTQTGTALGGRDGKDHSKIENSGRPFIVFGMGCHFSDYALYEEMSVKNKLLNDQNGDCWAELLLYQLNKGAVATYGSSGFEYLTPNRNLLRITYDIFFNSPPQDTMVASDRAQVRWILGEIMTLSEIRRGDKGQMKRYHILGDPLLRIDAGPPRFNVTVNDSTVQTGDLVFGAGENDTIHVEAVISDEVAIEKLMLEIDGEDATDSMTVTPLIDQALSASRKYSAKFNHKLRPDTYDIILRAYQSPDTTEDSYNIAAEFVMRVQFEVILMVDGQVVSDGSIVPNEADYLLELGFPVVVDQSSINVEIDGVPVQGLEFSHPSPEDSTTWLVGFHEKLSDGRHTLRVLVGGIVKTEITLNVSMTIGLKHVINYPNPFKDDTYFVYTNDVEITDGSISIFTVSGKKVARIKIPPGARLPGQNAVYWDGRDFSGDQIANGVYLYVVTVEQHGKRNTVRGKMVHID